MTTITEVKTQADAPAGTYEALFTLITDLATLSFMAKAMAKQAQIGVVEVE